MAQGVGIEGRSTIGADDAHLTLTNVAVSFREVGSPARFCNGRRSPLKLCRKASHPSPDCRTMFAAEEWRSGQDCGSW